MSNARLGMLLFLFSESVFFVFLLVAYIAFHSGPGKSSMAQDLDISKMAIFTGVLLLSSGTAWMAQRDLLKHKIDRFHLWLMATIILGSIFLFGQLSEYFRLFEKNVTVSKDPLSTGFFTVTGFHGIHVAIGVLLLTMVLIWSIIQKRRGLKLPIGGVESIHLYWHFVDVVWIAVFSIVYVWGTR